jgi:hypothetical protein
MPNLKFVTSGQNVDDAQIIPFILKGRSLRTPPPLMVGFFDDASGDLLIEIAGRTYIIDNKEQYELQMRDNTDTSTLRTQIINPTLSRPLQEYVIWDSASFVGGGTMTLQSNGGVIFSTSGGQVSSSASAEVVGGLVVEFGVPDSSVLPAERLAIFPVDASGISSTEAFFWTTSGSWPNYTAQPEGAFTDSPGPTISIGGGDRLGIVVRPDGVVEYHLNYTPSSKPIWISSRQVRLDVKYKVYVKGFTVTKVSWQRQGPEWKYTAGAQLLDRGLPVGDPLPATIKARVRQLCPVAGGPPSSWTNKVFTR